LREDLAWYDEVGSFHQQKFYRRLTRNNLDLVGKIIFYLSASAIMICKITSLCHEISNDPMEVTAFISKTWFTSAQLSKIF